MNLRDLCAKPDRARKKYGEQVAKTLQRRLADLMAAETLGDLMSLGIPMRRGDKICLIALGGNFALRIKHHSIYNSKNTRTEVAWPGMKRVFIDAIVSDGE